MVYFFTFRLYGQTIQPKTPISNDIVSVSTTNYYRDNLNNILPSTQQTLQIKSNNNSIVIISAENNMTQYGYFN